MKHHRAALLIALMSAVMATGLSPLTANAASSGVRKKTPKQAIDKGPAETRAERDKRLARECKGRPNAGACEGYGN
jgi:hypothetical protein